MLAVLQKKAADWSRRYKARLRFFRARRHALAENLDGLFQSLAVVPEVGPKVAFFFEPRKDGRHIQVFRPEIRPQFARKDRRRNRRLGKCAHGIGCSQRAAVRILLNVDQDAAGGRRTARW